MRRIADKPIVAITVGDYNGIGPEIILKSMNDHDVRKVCQPLLVGPAEVFGVYGIMHKIKLRERVPLVHQGEFDPVHIVPGTISAHAGETAAVAIAVAVRLVQMNLAHALVTAPISKVALHQAGFDFPGQTEMLQRLTGAKHVAMMLVSDTMRVGLATIHIPVSAIARTLTRPLLREKIRIIHDALKQDWKIRSPKIAVLGLNPHASEKGDIGREDVDIVAHVVKECRLRKMKIEGPFPADAFFGTYKKGMYDAIIAMYHDQGLIPLKMSSFGKGVNISAGLNIVRTSPDHGTAFDIAGKGIANPASMIEAIKLAALVATNRGIVRRARKKKK